MPTTIRSNISFVTFLEVLSFMAIMANEVEQAGAELSQAQLKLKFDLTLVFL